MNLHAVFEPARSRLRTLLQPRQANLIELLDAPQLASQFERLCQSLTVRHIVVIGATGREGVTSVATRLAITLARRADEIARLTANTISMPPDTPELAGLLQSTPVPPAPAGAPDGEATTNVPPANHRVQVPPPRPGLLDIPVSRPSGQVLLAEGNLRTPTLGAQLGVQTDIGLRQWNMKSPLPTFEPAGLPLLSVLLAGPATPGDDDALLSTRLTAAAERAQADFDYVIWDSPPLTLFPDAATLASRSEGALVVVEMDHTRIDDLQFVRETLSGNQIRVIGSILNRSNRYWPRPRRRTHYPATAASRG